MAITAYTGLPRSGKTYSVVSFVILPNLGAGRKIYTNIPLQWDEVRAHYPEADVEAVDPWDFDENNPDRRSMLDAFEPGSVVILDELWRFWPSGLKTTRVADDQKEFLAMHGHRVGQNGKATEVVLVTQDLSQIANFVRELVARTMITKKLDAVGMDKRANVDIYQGAVRGQRGPVSQFVRSAKIKYRAEVYRYYQSHSQSVTGEAGEEATTDNRASIWRAPSMIAGILFVLGTLGFSATWIIGWISEPEAFAADLSGIEAAEREIVPGDGLIGSGADALEIDESVPQVVPPEPEVESPKPESELSDKYSKTWRLVGTISGESGPGRALLISAGGRTMINADACQASDVGEVTCNFRGRIVAAWTGTGNGSFGSADAADR